MQTILLMMRRRPIAQDFMEKFKDHPDVHIAYEPNYETADAVHSQDGGVALIEVGETGGYDAAFCLALCKRLREKAPAYKLILLCPEQDEASVSQAVSAKRDGRIDDFVFYDASLAYLTSKLLSML